MIIVICGPEASGKMTVGQELEKNFNFHLLYNHQVIDLVGTVFDKEHIGDLWDMKEWHFSLISSIFKSFLISAIDNNENLVFTITWNFNNPALVQFFQNLELYAKKNNTKILFVELFSTLEERIKRNSTSNRLEHKVCKRNIENSTKALIEATNDFQLNSFEKMPFEDWLIIDNTNLLPQEVANKIINYIYEKL